MLERSDESNGHIVRWQPYIRRLPSRPGVYDVCCMVYDVRCMTYSLYICVIPHCIHVYASMM